MFFAPRVSKKNAKTPPIWRFSATTRLRKNCRGNNDDDDDNDNDNDNHQQQQQQQQVVFGLWGAKAQTWKLAMFFVPMAFEKLA